MGQPYVGEIRCFGFSFAPQGWAFCNGQLIPISGNETLFSILGTTYGGDGETTFAVPNLQGQIPMHWGNGPGGFITDIGESQGAATVSLTSNQIPIHNHAIISELVPPGGVNEHVAAPTSSAFIGQSTPDQVYNATPTINAAFSALAIGSTGGGQPHENMQPYLAVNFCIALFGVFPSRN